MIPECSRSLLRVTESCAVFPPILKKTVYRHTVGAGSKNGKPSSTLQPSKGIVKGQGAGTKKELNLSYSEMTAKRFCNQWKNSYTTEPPSKSSKASDKQNDEVEPNHIDPKHRNTFGTWMKNKKEKEHSPPNKNITPASDTPENDTSSSLEDEIKTKLNQWNKSFYDSDKNQNISLSEKKISDSKTGIEKTVRFTVNNRNEEMWKKKFAEAARRRQDKLSVMQSLTAEKRKRDHIEKLKKYFLNQDHNQIKRYEDKLHWLKIHKFRKEREAAEALARAQTERGHKK